ncbi:MAG: ATP synthase subunit I [Methylomonas sp.]|jgi:F1F0 ATPase subunit 2
MMIEPLIGLMVWAVGVLLGAVFFGGLWWTIRKSFASQRPALWFITSLLLRMAITLSGFYLIADGQWPRLLICLSGFVMTRIAIFRFASQYNKSRVATESSHAP